MSAKVQATLDDLYHVPEHGKAELVAGELIHMSPTGFLPGYAAGEIFVSLRNYAKQSKRGYAVPDNVGFVVDLPNRKSFSPDAAFYIGAAKGMRFLPGAPAFAVEVRSEGDYGPTAEQMIKTKRMDYFAAGTALVWDVDLLGADIIRAYHAADPDNAIIYGREDIAAAEPLLPGWTLAVSDLFPD